MPGFDRRSRLPTVALALALALAAACSESGGESSYGAEARAASVPDADARRTPGGDTDLGSGFVVWESNRSGAWRLWTIPLEGGEPRQLTADEPGRSHCCPHIRPGGAEIAYLSVIERAREYPRGDETGALRLIAVDGSGERELVSAARTYWENRAVVWRSSGELVYIDGQGVTRLLDLTTGALTALTAAGTESFGWLLDPTLEYATSGTTLFTGYDRTRKLVLPAAGRTGCQPYFTHDGRWGYWMAAPGGPLDAVELANGRRTTILRKSDEVLPAGLGYVYFPMISAGNEALAFAASADQHDHFRADYEIFVTALDPETLEPRGAPRRLTSHPATDRFPDIWVEPLPLGRWRGEAPFTVRLTSERAGPEARWIFGDGTEGRGVIGEHTYRDSGRYRVELVLPDAVLSGSVTVVPPAPPEVLSVSLADLGSTVLVRFDEPVDLLRPRISLASGTPIVSSSLTVDGRGLELALGRALGTRDRLHLDGVVDRAQVANRMSPTVVEIEPPGWPSNRSGLIFVWQTGDAPNLIFDPELGADRACVLEPRARARLDHDFAMRLGAGAFSASDGEANRLRWALQATNELTIELTVTPAHQSRSGRLVSLSDGRRGQNFFLAERDGRLVFGLRVGPRGPEAVHEIEVTKLEADRPSHLVVTYAPGSLHTYVDGHRVLASDEIDNGFFHWKSYRLTFGDEAAGGQDWNGTLEGIAIYDRVLPANEVRENHLRYAALRGERPRVPTLVVDARLAARSRRPSLAEITPYREALAVAEYEVLALVSGSAPSDRLRVAEWVLMDGEPVPEPAIGARRRLELEPYALNRQLESVYLADTLPGGEGTSLWYAVGD